jgi:hypothetical protein
MAMQTDVKAGHLNQSGVVYSGRTRLKGVVNVATASAGTVNMWDSLVAQTSATYARAGNVVTVTSNAHGLAVGQSIGIVYAAGGATNGNYYVQSVTTNTFTLTDLNSGTVTAGTAASWNAGGWLMSYDTAAAASTVNIVIPGEGIIAKTGIYIQMSNQTNVTVFYG